METRFVVGQRYPTRNGGEALVVGADRRGVFAVHYDDAGDFAATLHHFNNGGVCGMVKGSGNELIEPTPECREVWVNVYRDVHGHLIKSSYEYPDRAEADSRDSGHRVGCHRVILRAEFETPEAAS